MPSRTIRRSRFCVYRDRLRTVITAESRAYGFTLLTASEAMFLLEHEGVPQAPDVFLFAAGALAAMVLVVAFSFRRLAKPLFLKINMPVVPWGLIHAVSIFGGIAAAWLAVSLLSGRYAFLVVSFSGTLIYNLLLGLEAELTSSGSPTRGGKC